MAVADIQALKGKWLRPDGGYVIEITEVYDDGKMDAGYYNPNPINVSRAEAVMEETTIGAFIELWDTGYPGCTYTLTYDPETDQLRGTYYQAQIQRNFRVFFTRIK